MREFNRVIRPKVPLSKELMLKKDYDSDYDNIVEKSDRVTTVDGATGGTISGNVTVTDTLTADTLRALAPYDGVGLYVEAAARNRFPIVPLVADDVELVVSGNIGEKWVIPIPEVYVITALMPMTYVQVIDPEGKVVGERLLLRPGDTWEVDFKEGMKVYANKPVHVSTVKETRPAINLRILGTAYLTWLDRYNLEVYLYSPFADAIVHFYNSDGSFDAVYEVPRGRLFAVPDTPDRTDLVYFIESTAPIAVFKQGAGYNDTIHMIPASRRFVVVRGGTLHVQALYNGTSIEWKASDGTTGTITLDKGGHTTLGYAEQYAGPAYYLEGNFPFSCHNEADGDGVDQTPGLPLELLSNYYVLPRNAEFIAFGALGNFFLGMLLPDGSHYFFYATADPTNAVAYLRVLAKDLKLDYLPAGTVVTTSSPTWAMFEEYESNNENIWFGVRLL